MLPYAIAFFVIALILTAVLSGVLAAPALAPQPDARITTKSKLALMTTEGVNLRKTDDKWMVTQEHNSMHMKQTLNQEGASGWILLCLPLSFVFAPVLLAFLLLGGCM